MDYDLARVVSLWIDHGSDSGEPMEMAKFKAHAKKLFPDLDEKEIEKFDQDKDSKVSLDEVFENIIFKRVDQDVKKAVDKSAIVEKLLFAIKNCDIGGIQEILTQEANKFLFKHMLDEFITKSKESTEDKAPIAQQVAKQCADGDTLLFLAVKNCGQLYDEKNTKAAEILNEILKAAKHHQFNLDIRNHGLSTPVISCAARAKGERAVGYNKALQLLLEHKANHDAYIPGTDKGTNALSLCALSGNLEGIKILVGDINGSGPKRKKPFQWRQYKDQNVLHIIAEDGRAADSEPHLQCVRYIVKSDQSLIQQLDHVGRTPLHYAAMIRNSNTQLLQILMGDYADFCNKATSWAHQTNVTSVPESVRKDLIKTIKEDQRSLQKLLQDIIHKPDAQGYTPLMLAVQSDFSFELNERKEFPVIKALLRATPPNYIDFRKTPGDYPTALMMCTDLEVLKLLIKAGANLTFDPSDPHGKTVFQKLIEKERAEETALTERLTKAMQGQKKFDQEMLSLYDKSVLEQRQTAREEFVNMIKFELEKEKLLQTAVLKAVIEANLQDHLKLYLKATVSEVRDLEAEIKSKDGEQTYKRVREINMTQLREILHFAIEHNKGEKTPGSIPGTTFDFVSEIIQHWNETYINDTSEGKHSRNQSISSAFNDLGADKPSRRDTIILKPDGKMPALPVPLRRQSSDEKDESEASESVVFIAARFRATATIRTLIDLKARAEYPGSRLQPMHLSADRIDYESVALLHERGAKLNPTDAKQRTPFMYLCMSDNEKLKDDKSGREVKKLLRYFISKTDVFTEKDKDCKTALVHAAENNNWSVIDSILDIAAELKIKPKFGPAKEQKDHPHNKSKQFTLLKLAVWHQKKRLVERLIGILREDELEFKEVLIDEQGWLLLPDASSERPVMERALELPTSLAGFLWWKYLPKSLGGSSFKSIGSIHQLDEPDDRLFVRRIENGAVEGKLESKESKNDVELTTIRSAESSNMPPSSNELKKTDSQQARKRHVRSGSFIDQPLEVEERAEPRLIWDHSAAMDVWTAFLLSIYHDEFCRGKTLGLQESYEFNPITEWILENYIQAAKMLSESEEKSFLKYCILAQNVPVLKFLMKLITPKAVISECLRWSYCFEVAATESRAHEEQMVKASTKFSSLAEELFSSIENEFEAMWVLEDGLLEEALNWENFQFVSGPRVVEISNYWWETGTVLLRSGDSKDRCCPQRNLNIEELPLLLPIPGRKSGGWKRVYFKKNFTREGIPLYIPEDKPITPEYQSLPGNMQQILVTFKSEEKKNPHVPIYQWVFPLKTGVYDLVVNGVKDNKSKQMGWYLFGPLNFDRSKKKWKHLQQSLSECDPLNSEGESSKELIEEIGRIIGVGLGLEVNAEHHKQASLSRVATMGEAKLSLETRQLPPGQQIAREYYLGKWKKPHIEKIVHNIQENEEETEDKKKFRFLGYQNWHTSSQSNDEPEEIPLDDAVQIHQSGLYVLRAVAYDPAEDPLDGVYRLSTVEFRPKLDYYPTVEFQGEALPLSLFNMSRFFRIPKVKFLTEAICFAVFLILFSTMLGLNIGVTEPVYPLEWTVLCYGIGYFLGEIIQAFRLYKPAVGPMATVLKYFSGWNSLDTSILLALILMLIARSAGKYDGLYAVSGAICMLIMVARAMFAFWIEPALGPLVITMKRMLASDVTKFLILIIIVTYGFYFSFFFLVRGDEFYDGPVSPDNTNPDIAQLMVFDSSENLLRELASSALSGGVLGMLGALDGLEGDERRVASQILAFLYTVIIAIVLINLLIAMMGSSYSSIQERSRQLSLYSKVFMTVELQTVNLNWMPSPLNLIMLLPTLISFFCRHKRHGGQIHHRCSYCREVFCRPHYDGKGHYTDRGCCASQQGDQITCEMKDQGKCLQGKRSVYWYYSCELCPYCFRKCTPERDDDPLISDSVTAFVFLFVFPGVAFLLGSRWFLLKIARYRSKGVKDADKSIDELETAYKQVGVDETDDVVQEIRKKVDESLLKMEDFERQQSHIFKTITRIQSKHTEQLEKQEEKELNLLKPKVVSIEPIIELVTPKVDRMGSAAQAASSGVIITSVITPVGDEKSNRARSDTPEGAPLSAPILPRVPTPEGVVATVPALPRVPTPEGVVATVPELSRVPTPEGIPTTTPLRG